VCVCVCVCVRPVAYRHFLIRNRSRFEPECLDSPAQSWNGLHGWESWKRVGQHKAKGQDTLPYLALSVPRWGIFSRLAVPALACILVHGL